MIKNCDFSIKLWPYLQAVCNLKNGSRVFRTNTFNRILIFFFNHKKTGPLEIRNSSLSLYKSGCANKREYRSSFNNINNINNNISILITRYINTVLIHDYDNILLQIRPLTAVFHANRGLLTPDGFKQMSLSYARLKYIPPMQLRCTRTPASAL